MSYLVLANNRPVMKYQSLAAALAAVHFYLTTYLGAGRLSAEVRIAAIGEDGWLFDLFNDKETHHAK